MADIQYLNYGDLQIDLLALMTNMANLVLNYVNSQPWSSKRKNMFMSAYSDIIGRGIQGASNNTGQWTIDVNSTDLNLSGKSKKEQEMYGEAAYFIQQLMQGLVSDAETKKEEEKKDLPLFDNAYFNKRLKETISKDRFGGGEILWGSLDNNERDSLGRRSITGRTNQLIESLSKLSDSLKEGEYNFENSPYENLGDFKNRVNIAIEALKKDPYSAREVLERLGLNYDTYLSTGENEDSGLTDKDGNPLTYAQYSEQLAKQEEAKLQLLALDALKKANALKGVLSVTLGIHANEARYKGKEYQEWLANTYGTGLKGFNAINSRIQELLNKAYNSNERGKGLTNADKKELGNLLYMLRLNPNYQKSNVSLEELEELKKYLHFDKSAGNLIRLPFQNSEGRYTYADDKGNIYYLKPNQGKKFGNLKGTDSNYKNNFLQSANLRNQGIHLLSNGWETEDYARGIAALGDVISLGGFWANVGGSAVSLLADTTADIADESLSGWDVIKNLGSNLGWTAAGFIPGGKLGKTAKNIQRWGPKLFVALQDYRLLNDESSKKTWNKLTSDRLTKEGLNSEDLKNITYWVRALTGTTNATRATFRDIKYSKARGTSKQEFTTKDGSKKTLTNEEVAEINKIGATKGQKAAEEAFKSKTGKEISDNEIAFNESGRSGFFKNTRSKFSDKRLSGKTVIERSPEQQRYFDAYAADRNKGGWFGWRPIWSKGTSSYFDHFDTGYSLKNPLSGIGKRLDPYRQLINNTTQTTPTVQSTPSRTNSVSKERLAELRQKFGRKPVEQSNPKQEYILKQQHRGEKEIDLFLKSYGEGNNPSKSPFVGGYGSSNNKIKPGELVFDLGNGKKVKFSVSKEEAKLPAEQLRNKMQKRFKEQILNKAGKAIEGAALRKLKKQGWLKQGGKITDIQIDNFLKQYK